MIKLSNNTEKVDGYYPLLGSECFAKIMTYQLKEKENCVIETHKEYIDIQLTLSGTEGISIFNSDINAKGSHYNPDDDVLFLDTNNYIPTCTINNSPGYFTMIFPGEYHRPMEKNSMCVDIVQKVVIKVKSRDVDA